MRTSEIERKTKETDIRLSLSLDGGDVSIDTGVGFFDHMLEQIGKHGKLRMVWEDYHGNRCCSHLHHHRTFILKQNDKFK